MKLKKLIAIILTTITAACIAVGFSGCKDEDNGTDTTSALSAEKSLEIRQAYFDSMNAKPDSLECVQIQFYYGKYNGAYVCDIEAGEPHLDMETSYDIGGVQFLYPNSKITKVYYKNNFYKLTEAFVNGVLNLENIKVINAKHREKEALLYGLDVDIINLSNEKELEIKTAYYNQFNESDLYNSVEDVEIYGYFGEYNECWIVDLGYRSQVAKVYCETIDGVTIQHPTSNIIYAYKNENFYDLQQAFDNEYLTHNDLLKIKTACRNDWDAYLERI